MIDTWTNEQRRIQAGRSVAWLKHFPSAVYAQLVAGQNLTVKLYYDGVARCQSCKVFGALPATDCEHARTLHAMYDECYAEDALYQRQAVAA